MRTAKNRLGEFCDLGTAGLPAETWTAGSWLALVWGTGWYLGFCVWLGFGEGDVVKNPDRFDPYHHWGLAVVRLTTIITRIHAALFVLLVLDGIRLFQDRLKRSATPWVAWTLAFGVIAQCQGVNLGVQLLWRLNNER